MACHFVALRRQCRHTALIFGISIAGAIAIIQRTAIAQIAPDRSLGHESSILSPDVLTEQGLIDRIDGGAIRGPNLFHSFSEFNIEKGQRVYFANPTVIETIVSRVTGSNPSNLLGMLGILGDASLFFINPNGIVFGENAVLDINGSLLLSTAERVPFDSGYAFSAVTANAPPVLSTSAPIAGLESWLPQSGHIQTTTPLGSPENLTLSAANIDIGSSLSANGEINVVATDQLKISDRVTMPVRVSAGEGLLLQGTRALHLSTLSHPSSGITSGGAMILRSDAPIVGDALFRAGGPIRAERVDGRLGQLVSDGDPVFETAGDFAAEGYTGASLQILAGGSVTIPGDISIDSAGTPFNDSTVELSNGTALTLQGTTEPTVDIRAGTTQFFDRPNQSDRPTSANIDIGTIVNPTGTVYLTNRFAPNSGLTGNIMVGEISTADMSGGGDVILDAQGQITFDSIDVSGGDGAAFDFESNGLDVFGGDGGDVTLLAGGDIVMPLQSFLTSYGLRGGRITLVSDTAIRQEEGPPGAEFSELSTIETLGVGRGRNGDVLVSAPQIEIEGNIFVDTYGSGRSGDLTITGNSLIANQASLNTDTFFGSGNAGNIFIRVDSLNLRRSQLASNSISFEGGTTGTVTIEADTIAATEGAQIGSFSFINGAARDVLVTANDISLSGFDVEEGQFFPSAIVSTLLEAAVGRSGRVTINTQTLRILDGAKVGTSSFGQGDAGTTTVNASDAIVVDGAVLVELDMETDVEPSSISSELFEGATGQGGTVHINTPSLSVTNGGLVSALSLGEGPAGAVNIQASEQLLVEGIAPFVALGGQNQTSQISVLSGANSSDAAGSLTIQGNTIEIAEGARVTAASQGEGAGGNISIHGRTLALEREGLISAETTGTTGGDIQLQLSDVVSMTGGSRISATAGTAGQGGDGGNIRIDSTFVTAEANGNNDITANAFEGQGGSVDITAVSILGLTARSRVELESLVGTTNPEQLDPMNLPSSDITAISQANPSLNGVVIIRSPDVDPSRDTIDLPADMVDASRLIAQGCAADGVLAQELGSLIVTGRGGLPQVPSDRLSYPTLVLDWDRFEADEGTSREPRELNDRQNSTTKRPHNQRLEEPLPLVEVQALTRRADGTVILSAEHPERPPWRHDNPLATCVSVIP